MVLDLPEPILPMPLLLRDDWMVENPPGADPGGGGRLWAGVEVE